MCAWSYLLITCSRSKLERLDAAAEYEKRSEEGKELINLVVIGMLVCIYVLRSCSHPGKYSILERLKTVYALIFINQCFSNH